MNFMGFLGGCLQIVVWSLQHRTTNQEIWILFSAKPMPLQCQLNKLLNLSVCPCGNKGELFIHMNFESYLGIYFEVYSRWKLLQKCKIQFVLRTVNYF